MLNRSLTNEFYYNLKPAVTKYSLKTGCSDGGEQPLHFKNNYGKNNKKKLFSLSVSTNINELSRYFVFFIFFE